MILHLTLTSKCEKIVYYLNGSVPGSGFKPALARLVVDMELFALSGSLAFLDLILTGQVWAKGSKVTTDWYCWIYWSRSGIPQDSIGWNGSIKTIKAESLWSKLVGDFSTRNLEPDWAAFDRLHSACLRLEPFGPELTAEGLRPEVAHVKGRPRARRGELVAGWTAQLR